MKSSVVVSLFKSIICVDPIFFGVAGSAKESLDCTDDICSVVIVVLLFKVLSKFNLFLVGEGAGFSVMLTTICGFDIVNKIVATRITINTNIGKKSRY